MSYCRFSDDNWKSDVYAYESDRGYEIHVASQRYVGEIPVVPSIMDTEPTEWLELYNEHMEAVRAAERVPIRGPYDGESFVYATLQDLHDALTDLRLVGYHVPDFAFEAIKEEMNKEPNQ